MRWTHHLESAANSASDDVRVEHAGSRGRQLYEVCERVRLEHQTERVARRTPVDNCRLHAQVVLQSHLHGRRHSGQRDIAGDSGQV